MWKQGRDKGDGTKWEDKNVIAKFLAGGSSATSSPSPAPAPSAASKEEDPFNWDK